MMWSKVQKGENEKVFLNAENYEKSFYCAIKPAIYVGKCFGLFPIDISSTQPHEVTFHWNSFKCAFSTLCLVCSLTTSLFTVKNQIALGPLTPSNVIGIIFFSTCTVIAILFFNIARNFQSLVTQWSKIELLFLGRNYELPPTHWKLKKKIKVFLGISLSLAFAEHFMSLADHANRLSFKVKQCNITNFNPLELFITQQLSYVISNLPFAYNNYIGIVIEYLNIVYTFYWNYLDIFLVVISISLTDNFERLNCRLESFRFLHVNENTWSEVRLAHVQLCELVNMVNQTLGITFMISCMNDGYFILIQMLNVTNSLPFMVSKIYFWFSLLFLVARSSVTILMGSKVYESARQPYKVLRAVSSEMWCEEIQRFFNQISLETNALSGKHFFFIQRRLLFSMACALLTYELVLLQFDDGELNVQDVVDCKLFGYN